MSLIDGIIKFKARLAYKAHKYYLEEVEKNKDQKKEDTCPETTKEQNHQE